MLCFGSFQMSGRAILRHLMAFAPFLGAIFSFGGAKAEEALPQEECMRRPYSIEIHVTNIRDAKGTITIDLHGDDPEKFLKSGAKLLRMRVPAEKGEMKICVAVDKPGIYAVALYQDRDGDQKLDKTWIGLPSEPFGVSRDAPMNMAPPRHKDAAFDVKGPQTPISIRLRK
jgi:uncharacterized protein (DUF2141 family)